MGRCAKCGNPIPGEMAWLLCDECRRKEEDATSKNEAVNIGTSKGSAYTLSRDKSGNVYGTDSGGNHTLVHDANKGKRIFRRVLIITLIVLIIGFVSVRLMAYIKSNNAATANYVIDTPTNDSEKLFGDISYLGLSDTYRISVSKQENNFVLYAFDFTKNSINIQKLSHDDISMYRITFSGYEDEYGFADGTYYIGDINGVSSIVDCNNSCVHPEGTIYYASRYAVLHTLIYSNIMNMEVFTKADNLECGKNTEEGLSVARFVSSDDINGTFEYMLSLSNDNSEVRMTVRDKDEICTYLVEIPGNGNEQLPDFSTYNFAKK